MNSRVVKKLNEYCDSKFFKYHAHAGGYRGHSDVYGMMAGVGFFIEGKKPGEKLRPEQERFLADMAQAGAVVGVYHSVEEAVRIVEEGCLSRVGRVPGKKGKEVGRSS